MPFSGRRLVVLERLENQFMRQAFLSATLALAALNTLNAQTNFALLTREHTDLRILYEPNGSNVLDLAMRDEDRGASYASNEVILVVKEPARLTLPAGTPFGDGGQPFWILPQTQNVNLLYLGVSAEGIPQGVFGAPLTVSLKRLEGPGYFMAWQATGPGQFNIRINTRDGISAADTFTPIIGSHEHFNWGFSSTGVFSATFQVSGRRLGDSVDLVSRECTFAFHVVPLSPPTNFVAWQRGFWPPGFNPTIAGAGADPDGDGFDNWREYAFRLSPTNANPLSSAPLFAFVEDGGQRFGSLTFTRYTQALDLDYSVEATSSLPVGWTRLDSVFNIVADTVGSTEQVTIRDSVPVSTRLRFFRLNLRPR